MISRATRIIGPVALTIVIAIALTACGAETVEVPGETVVVEKEVIKEVQVPGETVVVEKVVTETVEVPGETVTVEVVKEVQVPGETVVVEKEVIKTVEVPGETVVVEKAIAAAPAPQAAPQAAPPPSSPSSPGQPPATTFEDNQRTAAVRTTQDSVSTFSLDTDRTSFQLALNWARSGYDVEPDSVRSEEWVNAFDYGYKQPSRGDSFAIQTDVMPHPLDSEMLLARIGFQAPELRDEGRPLNVTLVLDASGSMREGNRVEIARAAADSIRRSLSRDDRISVVHFTTDVVDSLTVENERPDSRDVRRSIDQLKPRGSTNVQAGLDLGVELADSMRR